jgi:hypothetical protein
MVLRGRAADCVPIMQAPAAGVLERTAAAARIVLVRLALVHKVAHVDLVKQDDLIVLLGICPP